MHLVPIRSQTWGTWAPRNQVTLLEAENEKLAKRHAKEAGCWASVIYSYYTLVGWFFGCLKIVGIVGYTFPPEQIPSISCH